MFINGSMVSNGCYYVLLQRCKQHLPDLPSGEVTYLWEKTNVFTGYLWWSTSKHIPYGSMATVSEGTANPLVIIPQSHFLGRYGWIHRDIYKRWIFSKPCLITRGYPLEIPSSIPNDYAYIRAPPSRPGFVDIWRWRRTRTFWVW